MNPEEPSLISVQDLEQQASELIRRVRENLETFLISCDGEIVAEMIPFESEKVVRARASKVWTDLEGLAREIREYWPNGVSVLDAVQEQRREL